MLPSVPYSKRKVADLGGFKPWGMLRSYCLINVIISLLTAFLQSCSNEMFFRQISALLRTSNLSSTVLEKIATILSKLSKVRLSVLDPWVKHKPDAPDVTLEVVKMVL